MIADILPEVAGLDATTQRIAALFTILQSKVGAEGSFRVSAKSIANVIGFDGDAFEIWIRLRGLENRGLLKNLERSRGCVPHRYAWIGGPSRIVGRGVVDVARHPGHHCRTGAIR